MTNADQRRYARQHALQGFGFAGQERLAAARVLIVGAGGLGSPAATYLAAAGVGAITIVDSDTVDETNLHRQLLYGTRDIGRRKTDAAKARLADINPSVAVTVHDTRVNATNATALVAGHDIVIDATDNFPARYAINDACLDANVPFVYGSVARFEGQVSVFGTVDGPCYRCLFPEMPAPGSVPTCAEEGVLGVVPGIIGLYQATETIKVLAGIGTPLVGRLMLIDLLANETQVITVHRRGSCDACNARNARSDSLSIHPSPSSRVPNPVSFSTPVPQLSPEELVALLASATPPVVLDVREQWEYDIAHLPVSTLIPLSDLQARVHSLDKDGDFVVMCHHGMRSEMAAQWLHAQGFSRVANLDGGIDRWSKTIDTSLAQY